MAKKAKTKSRKRPVARKKSSQSIKPRPKRMTAAELARKHQITADAVRKKMSRYGYKAGADRKYSEAEFLKAHKAGLEADKNAAAKTAQDSEKPTLQNMILTGRNRLMDIQIQKAQAELDDILGRSISVDHHREIVEQVQLIMLNWWDKASEIAATKIKDAKVLRQLREARDQASQQILEVLE